MTATQTRTESAGIERGDSTTSSFNASLSGQKSAQGLAATTANAAAGGGAQASCIAAAVVPYDCGAEYAKLQVSCKEPLLATEHAALLDCGEGDVDNWPTLKRDWCCQHQGNACREPVSANETVLADNESLSEGCCTFRLFDYTQILHDWLSHATEMHQVVFAAITMLAGMVLALGGEPMWRVIFVSACAVLVSFVVHHELSSAVDELSILSQTFVLLAAAGASVVALCFGFDGAQFVLGAALGFMLAYDLASTCVTSPIFMLMLCDAGAVCGILILSVWPKAFLTTLAPLTGAWFAACGIETLGAIGVARATGNESPTWIATSSTHVHGRGLPLPSLQGCAAIGAALVHRATGKRGSVIVCLMSGIVVAAAMDNHRDPSFMRPKPGGGWPAAGCVMWATFSAAAAWLNLGTSPDWEPDAKWLSLIVFARGGSCSTVDSEGTDRLLSGESEADPPRPIGAHGLQVGGMTGPKPGNPVVPRRPP